MPTPPARAIPSGPYGYTNIQRRNATINQPTDPRLATVRNIADLFVPSARSVRRWKQRIRDVGNPDRLGAKGLRGKFKLSRRGAFVIWFYKHVRPGAMFVEIRRFIALTTGESLTPSQCSRELKRLGFTRKKLERQSKNRCEASRVRWWTHGPDAPQIEERGVAGLDARLLVDIDEKGLWLDEANRTYGHAVQGQRAADVAPIEQHEGIKATLLLVRTCMLRHARAAVIAVATHSRHAAVCAGGGLQCWRGGLLGLSWPRQRIDVQPFSAVLCVPGSATAIWQHTAIHHVRPACGAHMWPHTSSGRGSGARTPRASRSQP